jgi:hypothetical protein
MDFPLLEDGTKIVVLMPLAGSAARTGAAARVK